MVRLRGTEDGGARGLSFGRRPRGGLWLFMHTRAKAGLLRASPAPQPCPDLLGPVCSKADDIRAAMGAQGIVQLTPCKGNGVRAVLRANGA